MSSTPRLPSWRLRPGSVSWPSAAGFFFMSRGQESSQAATGLTAQQLVQRAAAKRKTAATPQEGRENSGCQAFVAPKPRPKPKATRVDRTLEQPGFRARFPRRFLGAGVVVVALYAPDVPLDEMAVAEARAGAGAAGVGFVAFERPPRVLRPGR